MVPGVADRRGPASLDLAQPKRITIGPVARGDRLWCPHPPDRIPPFEGGEIGIVHGAPAVLESQRQAPVFERVTAFGTKCTRPGRHGRDHGPTRLQHDVAHRHRIEMDGAAFANGEQVASGHWPRLAQ